MPALPLSCLASQCTSLHLILYSYSLQRRSHGIRSEYEAPVGRCVTRRITPRDILRSSDSVSSLLQDIYLSGRFTKYSITVFSCLRYDSALFHMWTKFCTISLYWFIPNLISSVKRTMFSRIIRPSETTHSRTIGNRMPQSFDRSFTSETRVVEKGLSSKWFRPQRTDCVVAIVTSVDG